MKKTLIIIASIFVFLIGAALAIPYLFKDQIVARIQQEMDEQLDAKVYFDADKISLSLFRHFPSVSAGIADFGIVGVVEFEGDTLMQVDQLDLDFSLKSVIFDEYPSLTGLHINGGDVLISVLEDGTANYDILKESEEEPTEEESNFKLGIEEITAEGVNLIYDDRSLDFTLALANISASGSGEFTSDIYDLPLEAEALIAEMIYEEVHYLSNKSFKGQTILQVDLEQMNFVLSESNFTLNEFLFDVNGLIGLPEEGINYDLTFGSAQTEFKNLLSLVPGMYSDQFSEIRADGELAFGGFVKGLYSDDQYPSFDVSLKVSDGEFQYPDLPTPIKSINLDINAKNETSILENTQVSIPDFSLLVGSNPISGNFRLENLRDYLMEGTLRGKLDLAELTSIFPIEGTELAGNLNFDASAKGTYDSTLNTFPVIQSTFDFQNGRVRNEEFPSALEEIHAQANLSNTQGTMRDFLVDVKTFGFELEEERIEGKFQIQDFEKLNWEGSLIGAVDLEKLTQIIPIEDTELRGKIQADLSSSGSYEAVENKNYSAIQAAGTINVSDFYFVSNEYPQGVEIKKSTLDFNPRQANLTEFDAVLGTSPLQASGSLSNYMEYLLSESGILKGQLSLRSSRFNVNEWLTENPADTVESALEVVPLPENVNFAMDFEADEVLYDNLTLSKAQGKMMLSEGILRFSDAGMESLGGQIRMNGSYDPRDLSAPRFDFALSMVELSIAEAFQKFSSVKAFAPVAQDITGRFNSNFSFSGLLGQDMMPLLSSIDVEGILNIAEAALRESKILEGITSLTKLKDASTLQLKDLSIPIQIEDGRMDVSPFNLRLWDYETTIQGTAGFDGSINYLLNMQVPAGEFGAQANSILATISGSEADESTLIPLALNLSGTYNQPKVSLAGGNSIETLLANALKSRLQGEKENLQEKATAEFQAAQDSIKQELKLKSESAQDSLKKALEKKTEGAKTEVVNEAKTMLRNLLKPKKTDPDTSKKEN
ncbi:AsmA-like C-terminal region-containing protein [Algoriphagus hitonicola]|uniref:AsmA-like C-terminal region n=1 Tax=Algoriphagus hitonicola TaxID=435880 RepID=A0A1I2SG85_9BACT|nr:AsmA-like C-terminal region-containing protein [Algoriphagus hitonicola]SFG51732.1 AsmA-like C-terminal region [Algoriphagus hitonicola]